MSTIQEQRRLHLEAKAIAELKERLARQAYMSVREVAKRLHLSREKVEAIPAEVLPYVDLGVNRALRRYHPADVLALDARMRAWKAAQADGRGEAYLAELRGELELRDAAALQVAEEMGRAVA